MKTVGKKALITVLMLSPLYANVVWADEAAMNQRIDRLERIIKGQGLVSLLSRVDQLQNEIQRLNGDNESLRHEIKEMQKRQRDLYLDLDQRLQAQSQAATGATAPATESIEAQNNTTQVESESTPTEQQAAAETQTPDETPTTVPVAVENGEAAYQAALQTLRGGQYEQAITALSAFPETYPQSHYLPNAYYWKGEANYVLRHFDQAIIAFQTVIDRFPASSKVADASLKLGFSQYELGNIDTALATLNKVIEDYPNTSAARLAKVRLDRINQANR